MRSFKKSGVILRVMTILMITLAVESKTAKNYTDLVRNIKISVQVLKNVSKYLESACTKRYSSKSCTPYKVNIPGYDSNWAINMKDEQFLAESKKRLTLFIIHIGEVQKHLASVKKIKQRVKNLESWLTKSQKDHGYNTLITMKRPAKLKSIGVKTDLDWHRAAMQLMGNLKNDLVTMEINFGKP